MQFLENEKFFIIRCEKCGTSGYRRIGKCSACAGRGRGMIWRNEFWYWTFPLTVYHRALRKGREVLGMLRIMAGLIFGLGSIAFFFWESYRLNAFAKLSSFEFWFGGRGYAPEFFWLGIIGLLYVWYRMIRASESGFALPVFDLSSAPQLKETDWRDIKKIKGLHSRSISAVFTESARKTLDSAFGIALAEHAAAIEPKHLFLALANNFMVGNMFVRLGVSPATIKARAEKTVATVASGNSEPRLSESVERILFSACETAVKMRDSHVRENAILLALVREWKEFQEILYAVNIDETKLESVTAWVKIREQLREEYTALKKAGSHRNKHGIDRAMTAVATPFLNNFSDDLTRKAQLGLLNPSVARDAEIDSIFRVIEGGQQSVLLVGLPGVGKMSIIEGIAQRMVRDQVPKRLQDKRLVQISTSSLLAGTTVSGAQERLIKIMNELSRARNIILVINNVADLIGSANEKKSSMSVAETLAEYLGTGRFLTLATARPDDYHKYIATTKMSSLFAKVDVPVMTEAQAIQVLESKAGYVEYKHGVYFFYDALAWCVRYAAKFLNDQFLPQSALTLFSESASFAHRKHPNDSFVRPNDVAAVIEQKTGIPSASITEDESEKLLRLETEMHERVVGQSEAVVMVASALRRARAEIRSKGKPIANFLFLGPTGVGKTELAKTIADVYFGKEDRMIRLDMSEYQDKTGIYRLIGEHGQQGTGLLTEAVREKPFSLILLDELEKADPGVLNLFLSVFDDGRLTDSVGRVIDFTNTIIIATSNAGTGFIQEKTREGVPVAEIKERLLRNELKQYYRPEFLNRFDGIVVFTPLTRDETKQIAALMLKRVAKDLEARGVELRVEDAALNALVVAGYDPEFGARPMRRAIQELVEDKLAEYILGGKLNRRDVITLGEKCSISVQHTDLPL